jgi:exopolysaccharide biosynthesis protein
MKIKLRLKAGILAAVSFCWFLPVPIVAEKVTARDSALVCHHDTRRNPNLSLHWLWLDLGDTNISVQVAKAGGVPPNSGRWVTTLLPTSEIAAREAFDVAINGDFFGAENTVDTEGKKTGYIRGKLAEPVGPAMTRGLLWHQAIGNRPCLEITCSNTAKIFEYHPAEPVDPGAQEILGGGQIIVSAGKPVLYSTEFSTFRHPRTAVGIDRSGRRLLLLEVDGRQPALSVGMSLAELSEEMIKLGCDTALNLDGGGSATMVWRDTVTRRLKVVNSPSDTRERAVADIFGAKVYRLRRETN